VNHTLAEFARLSGGALQGGDRAYSAVSTDSRSIGAGELFVALSGPNFDGHDFALAAAERGAAGAVVGRRLALNIAQIVVDDPLAALQRAATAWRAGHSLPIVGVAGSNGKTTTKELVASILSVRGSCLSTRGNLNNHIGVPLTLLRIRPEHTAAVIEMGANARGDIAQLTPWVDPTVGIVTNAGAEHLEGFGDLDGVAAGEGELYQTMAGGSVAVINAGDAYASFWRNLAGQRPILTFGLDPTADFRLLHVRATADDDGFRQAFVMACPLGEIDIELRLGGSHNIVNALGAAAAAYAVGAGVEDIRAGLGRVEPVKGRLQLKVAAGGSRLIDDSYNANPSSLDAGFALLKTMPGEKWLVLGDMGELGSETEKLHAEAGRSARAAGISRLFAIGTLTGHSVDTFGAGGEWFASPTALAEKVRPMLQPGVTVLVKGSRVNRLERVVEALTGNSVAQ
jgi:UDP-N-acetylmuramoyl-tripeptide--D-alanyl-D-alanine ligase